LRALLLLWFAIGKKALAPAPAPDAAQVLLVHTEDRIKENKKYINLFAYQPTLSMNQPASKKQAFSFNHKNQ